MCRMLVGGRIVGLRAALTVLGRQVVGLLARGPRGLRCGGWPDGQTEGNAICVGSVGGRKSGVGVAQAAMSRWAVGRRPQAVLDRWVAIRLGRG